MAPSAHAQEQVQVSIQSILAEYDLARGGYTVSASLGVVGGDGLPINGLTASDFVVQEDGVAVGQFDIAPSTGGIRLILAIDTSGSMGALGTILAVREATTSLIEGLQPEDQVGLVSFNNEPRVELNLTSDHAAAQNFIQLLEPVPDSNTCLWDAAYEAVELASAAPHGRRAVVLLTDGVDERRQGGPCSSRTLDDVVALATDPSLRVPVTAIGVGSRINELDLGRLAELTGGNLSIAARSEDLADLFTNLSLRLRGGYTLTYWTPATSGEHSLFVQAAYLGSRDQDVATYRAPGLPGQATISGVAEGEDVSGGVELGVTLVSPVAAAVVEFRANGALFAEDEVPPYEAVWATSALSPGDYLLRAVALAEDGSPIAVAETMVTVEAPEAPQASALPSVTVRILAPERGATIRTRVEVQASIEGATDQVRRIMLLADGFVVEALSGSSPVALWDPRYLDPGQHTLSVVAYDAQDRTLGRDDINIVYSPPAPIGAILGVTVAVLLAGALAFALYHRVRQRGETAAAAGGPAVVSMPRAPGRAAPTEAVLTVEACQDPALVGQRFEIWETRVVIGRASECEIGLPVQPVSRRHAEIRMVGAAEGEATIDAVALGEAAPRFRIYDGDPATGKPSAFGTFVDGISVPPDTGLPLNHRCRIRLGRPLAEGRASPVILRFEDARMGAGRAGEAEKTVDELLLPEATTRAHAVQEEPPPPGSASTETDFGAASTPRPGERENRYGTEELKPQPPRPGQDL
jgi:Mg-chelatase subunit ChlD